MKVEWPVRGEMLRAGFFAGVRADEEGGTGDRGHEGIGKAERVPDPGGAQTPARHKRCQRNDWQRCRNCHNRAVISFAQLFGRTDRFFDLLEASAVAARSSIVALDKLLQNPGTPAVLDEFAAARRDEKKIASTISEELVKTFVTALEGEDIEALSRALYRIPKTVEKCAERYEVARGLLQGASFAPQMEIACKAGEVIVTMTHMLRVRPTLERMKEENDKLQYLEGEADRLILGFLRSLYAESSELRDPLRAMASRDIHDLLEKIIDRCRDVGNTVVQIVLKNS